MFNKDDILARLHYGDSVDEIATEMATALNAAKTAYDEAEAKRIEEEKKIVQEKEIKRSSVVRIIEAFADYAKLMGKREIADKLGAMTDNELDDVAEAFDAMIELTEMAEKVKLLEFGMPKSILIGDKAESLNNVFKSVPKPVQQVPKRTPDDIISEFLKTL